MSVKRVCAALGFLALVVVLAGCGSLELTVDIADPQVVEAERDRLLARNLVPTLHAATDHEIRGWIQVIEDAHFSAYKEIAVALRARKAQVGEEEGRELEYAAKSFERGFDQTGDESISWRASYRAASDRAVHWKWQIDQIVLADPYWPEEDRQETQREFSRLARMISESVDSLMRTAERDTGRKFEGLASRFPWIRSSELAVATPIRDAQAVVMKSPIAGGSIVGNEFAYAVASAPEGFWHRSFNEVWGSGVFGNLDMAIRMNELGDFMLKGLTFDPRDVALMASKVGVQAMIIAAQISGVPISAPAGSGGQTPAPGSALASSSKSLQDLQDRMTAKLNSVRQQRMALKNLGNIILAEKGVLGTNNFQTGVDRVLSGYEVLKTKITITPASAGGTQP